MEPIGAHLKEQLGTPAANSADKSAGLDAPGASRARFFRLLRVVGWGVLLALALAILVNEVLQVSQQQTDFCQDYLAAQRLSQGIPVYLPMHCWSGFIPSPQQYDAHPPFSILFIWPLSLLPETLAATLWGLGLLAGYLVSGALLLQALGWRSLRGLALFAWGSVFWSPLTLAVGEQNFGQLLTLLLVVAWLLERKGRDGWAGGLIGLAGLLKVWPLLLLLAALVQRRWRLAWTGAATLLVGTVLTLVMLGPGAYAAYLGPVRASELYWIPNGASVSLVSLLMRLFTGYPDPPLPVPALAPILSLGQAALLAEVLAGLLLAAALLLLWWRARQTQTEPASLLSQTQIEPVNLLSQDLLVTVLLLVFPLTWYWEIIPALLPVTTTILALRQLARPPRWWLGLFICSLLLLVFPRSWITGLAGWLLHRQGPGLEGAGVLVFGLPTYGLLLFAGAQAWLLWQVRPPVSAQMRMTAGEAR